MNILIPHSWLKEYLQTRVKPKRLAECLSLCGASVEKITSVVKDHIYEIEVTTNRVDMMSVLGIAREAAAILPEFNLKAELKKDPYKTKLFKPKLKGVEKPARLKVEISDPQLCPRFTALVLDNVQIKPSPKLIKDRLKKVGVRPLNNLIDISNYLMHELGQPIHVFDYQQIKKSTMIVRESKKGEKIVTLDGKKHRLPGGDIVIEDGQGRLIDLCGIMGAKNSAVNQKTTTCLLFVQNYEPARIRKTSMSLGIRTEAAALFEKKIDPELVIPTIKKGAELIEKYANGRPKSNLIDFYPQPYKPKKVKVSLQLIKDYLGTSIQLNKVKQIFTNLGLKTRVLKSKTFKVAVPSWRATDINISQDLIEEVARIYGYHNISDQFPALKKPPSKPNTSFDWEKQTKHTLKNWGFTELYTYSMHSLDQLKNFDLKPKQHLKVRNPLTQDWVYMRTNLLPGLLSAVKNNQQQGKQQLKLFELNKVYLPQEDQLPQEKLKLALLMTNQGFLKLKGRLQALLNELGIKKIRLSQSEKAKQWLDFKSAAVYSQQKKLGVIGQIKPRLANRFDLNCLLMAAYLDFDQLAKLATTAKNYQPLSQHPPVIEDLTFTMEPQTYYRQLIKALRAASELIAKVELIDQYQNNFTLRISYQHPKKNLSTAEVGKVRKKIISQVQNQGLAKLKGKVKD